MTFLQPWWFLAAPLALLIVALHIRRRTTLRVGSIGLWQRIADTSTSRFVWQPPPITAALILQVLAFLLVVTALARPALRTDGLGTTGHLVVVVDTSESMGARMSASDERTRLDAAKAHVRGIASGSTASMQAERVSLLAVGVRTDARVVRAADASDLARAVADLQRTGGTVAWDDVARRVSALAASDTAVAVRVLTDGAQSDSVRSAFAGAGLGDRVDVIAFGRPVDNAALVDVRLEPVDVDGSPATRVVGSVARHFAESAPVPLSIWFTPDGTSTALPWHEEDVTGDGTSLSFSIDLDLPGPGLLDVRLPDDGADADNRWMSSYVPSPRQADVLVVGPGNPALERALASIDHVNVARSAALPSDSASYGLVVVDGVSVPSHPGTSTLWIGSMFASAGNVEPATATSWNPTHPISAGVDWAGLVDVRVAADDPPEGAASIVAAGGNPIVWARTTAAGREVGLGFDPAGHAWSQTLGFPVFVDNVVRWAVPDLGRIAPAPCRVGALCAIRPQILGSGVTIDPIGLEGPDLSIPPPFVSDVSDAPPHERWIPAGIESGFVPDRAGPYRVGAVVGTVLPASAAEANLRTGADEGGQTTQDAPAPRRVAFDLAVLAALVAAALLVAEAAIAWRSDPRVTTSRSQMLRLLGLRAVAVALIAVAVLDVPLPAFERVHRSVVVLDDPSLLTPEARDRALASVDASASGAGAAQDARAMVAEGLGMPMGPDALDVAAGSAASSTTPPDLAAMLDTAQAWLGPEPGGRIILATNASVASGALTDVWHELSERKTTVEYLPVAYGADGDVAMSDVRGPRRTAPGIPFTLHGTIHASGAQAIDIALLRDGEPIDERRIDVASGATEVVFERRGEPIGAHVYEIAVRGAAGRTGNDRDGAVVEVGGSARIALVTERPEAASLLRDVLANAGLAGDVLAPEDVPYRMPELLPYDVVMLLDVPAVTLHSVQQELLETWVREHGGGLVIGGGRNTFGPGGYYQTPLEEASPLSSRIPGEAPQVALLFVLDRSGSMTQQVGGVSRLAIAKQATADAAVLLDDESSVGIVVFDELARVLFPLQSVTNLAAMREALAPLDAAGGTSMYPALLEAVDQFATVDASAKHIVLMSDGLSEPGDFRGVVDTLRSMGVTVSSVAIGQGADAQVLSSIATWGGGAFHATTDFRALPSILAQETLLLSGTPIEEGVVRPSWASRDAAFLDGMPDVVPPLDGFVRTTAKPEATVHITGPEDAPILASWRHGLGRTVAFTSEAAGTWIQPWLASEAYPLLWTQAARWVAPPVAKPGLHIQAMHEADGVRITATGVADDGSPATGLPLMASLRAADGTVTTGILVERLDGHYVGSVPTRSTGSHVVEVRATGDDPAVDAVETPVYVSYPATLRIDAPSSQAARGLAMLTGGRTLLGGEAPPAGSVGTRWTWNDAWTLWLVAALAVFLVELLLRYGRAWLRTIARFGSRWAKSPPDRAPERGAASSR